MRSIYFAAAFIAGFLSVRIALDYSVWIGAIVLGLPHAGYISAAFGRGR